VFQAQRLVVIRNLVSEQKTVDVSTLTRHLNVSEVTVRKDLEKLEAEGFLRKLHGGAVLAEQEEQHLFQAVEIIEYSSKLRIAELAVELIDDDDSIFLGGGSTCSLFAKLLSSKHRIRVVTNNFNAVHFMFPAIRNIYFLGGNVEGIGPMLYSKGQTETEIEPGIFVNKAFFSVDGVDVRAGFTVNDYSRAVIIKYISKIAKKIVILADHTKFGEVGMHQALEIEAPDFVVTNEVIDDMYKTIFFNKNIKVLTSLEL